jgi:hypothetical protein
MDVMHYVFIFLIVAGPVATFLVLNKRFTGQQNLLKEKNKEIMQLKTVKKPATVGKDEFLGIEAVLREPYKSFGLLKPVLAHKKDMQKPDGSRDTFNGITAPFDELITNVLTVVSIPLFKSLMADIEARQEPGDLVDILNSNLEEIPEHFVEAGFNLRDEKWTKIVRDAYVRYIADKVKTYSDVEDVFNFVNGKKYFDDNVGEIKVIVKTIKANNEQPEWVKITLQVSDKVSIREVKEAMMPEQNLTEADIEPLLLVIKKMKEIYSRPLLTTKAMREISSIALQQIKICDALCRKHMDDPKVKSIALKTMIALEDLEQEFPIDEGAIVMPLESEKNKDQNKSNTTNNPNSRAVNE